MSDLIPYTRREIQIAFSQELPPYFTFAEIQKIITPDLRRENPKAWLLCSVLWQTGPRVSEVLGLQAGAVDPGASVVRYLTLKRKDKLVRVVPTQRAAALELHYWITENKLSRTDRIFPYTRQTAFNLVRKACALAGFDDERCHPHTFRHSFAINCLLNGVPVTVLQSWLGHRNIANTLIYLKALSLDSRQFIDQVQF